MANKTFKLFADKLGGRQASAYIGTEGEIFYDPESTTLRISNGSTPGGLSLSSGGSGVDLTSVSQNIIPSIDSDGTTGYTLGSPTKKWKELFVSNGSIYIGDIKLSNVNGKLSAKKVINPGQENEQEHPQDSDATSEIGGGSSDRLVNGDNTVNLEETGTLTTPAGLSISKQFDGNAVHIGSSIQSDFNKNLRLQAIGTGSGDFAWQNFEGDANFVTLNYNQSKNIMITVGNAVGEGVLHNWLFASTGNIQLPPGGDIVDIAGNSVLGGGSRVKLESPGDRRIEEVYGYKEVSVTEVVLGTPVSAIVHSSNTEYWQFYIHSSEELMTLYNSGTYIMEVSVDQNNWISAYVGGYNGLDALQIVLNNGATLQVYGNDTVYYRINTGGEPVVWWDKAELPGGGGDFRGATIDYHAFTGESTIIGTIHIVDDDGEEYISHTEVQSGSSDGENDDLWLVNSEGQIQYRRIDKEEKTLKVQWSAKVFYGSELYD